MNKPIKSTHGGRRKGAGRKTEDGARDMLRVNVMLDQPTIDRATKLGDEQVGIIRADSVRYMTKTTWYICDNQFLELHPYKTLAAAKLAAINNFTK